MNKIAQVVTINPDDYIKEDHNFSKDDDSLIVEVDPDDDVEFVESAPNLILLDVGPEVEEAFEDQVVSLDEPETELVIVIDDIPGAPKGTKLPQIEIVEEDNEKIDKKDSNNLEQKEKQKGPWDWRGLDSEGFFVWIKERFDSVPKHSGFDTAGLERAKSYLEKLDSEISAAMREDIDGTLDENKIEQIRNQIENGLNKIKDRIRGVKDSKKSSTKKAEEELEDLVKTGQKVAGIGKVLVTVPLLISRIARVCINSVVSAGKDLKLVFDDQVEKYKLNDREQAELLQLLEDMGYPLQPMDRGYKYEESYSRDSNKNYDFNQNFRG